MTDQVFWRRMVGALFILALVEAVALVLFVQRWKVYNLWDAPREEIVLFYAETSISPMTVSAGVELLTPKTLRMGDGRPTFRFKPSYDGHVCVEEARGIAKRLCLSYPELARAMTNYEKTFMEHP